eukprot:jgi/Botrbrau1/11157/Bobra.182_2s0012.1
MLVLCLDLRFGIGNKFVTSMHQTVPATAGIGRSPSVHAVRLSNPPRRKLAAHCSSNDETDPTKNIMSLGRGLRIFLGKAGWVQKPLETLKPGRGIRMQTPKGATCNAWKTSGGCCRASETA